MTKKMVLDISLLSTQHYEVQIKDRWSNRGKELHHPLHLGVVAIEKEAFRFPSTTVSNLF